MHFASLAAHGGSVGTRDFLVRNHPMRKPAPADFDALYDAMIAIATHTLAKPGLAALFRRLIS